MNVPTLSLNNTTLCSCCNPENHAIVQKNLDDYNTQTVIITYFDPTITKDQKENAKIYIPTDSTKYITNTHV